MNITLKLQLETVCGGDGEIRYIEEKTTKLDRTKSKKKSNQVLEVETSSGEIKTEIIKKEVQTFKMIGNTPIQRLGGAHGKLWGHMRAAGRLLADLGEPGFESKAYVDRLMQMIIFSPGEVKIKPVGEIYIMKIPQITAGMNKAMMIQYFDCIPKGLVDIDMSYPEAYKNIVYKMLEQMEKMTGLNKRRTTLTILNKKEVFK